MATLLEAQSGRCRLVKPAGASFTWEEVLGLLGGEPEQVVFHPNDAGDIMIARQDCAEDQWYNADASGIARRSIRGDVLLVRQEELGGK